MGFWYFLMLIIGGMIVSVALIKHSKNNTAKWSKVFIGVDSLLQSMNIRL